MIYFVDLISQLLQLPAHLSQFLFQYVYVVFIFKMT